MSTLHRVYRCAMTPTCRWRGYVVADDADIEAASLPEARLALTEVLAHRIESWPWNEVTEHTEHALAPGLWVREALDTHAAERAHITRVLAETLSPQSARAALTALSTGGDSEDLVVVAAVSGDRLDWLLNQHHGTGALVVATALSNHSAWFNALDAGPGLAPGTTTLADLGLSPADTLDDWLTASPTGARLALPTAPATTAPVTAPRAAKRAPGEILGS